MSAAVENSSDIEADQPWVVLAAVVVVAERHVIEGRERSCCSILHSTLVAATEQLCSVRHCSSLDSVRHGEQPKKTCLETKHRVPGHC